MFQADLRMPLLSRALNEMLKHLLRQSYCRLLRTCGRFPHRFCTPVHVLCHWHTILRKACRLLHMHLSAAGPALNWKKQDQQWCGKSWNSLCTGEENEARFLFFRSPYRRCSSGYTHRHILPVNEAIPCLIRCGCG